MKSGQGYGAGSGQVVAVALRHMQHLSGVGGVLRRPLWIVEAFEEMPDEVPEVDDLDLLEFLAESTAT